MIEIVFLDIDGCLSDGGIYKGNAGEELKRFDVKDGFLLQQWNKMGKICAIITGKSSQIVTERAAELGVKHCFQGVSDKFAKASEILKIEGLDFTQAAAVGDDLNDLKLLKSVALSFAPKDAVSEVSATVKCRLKNAGGRGAVREMLEFVLKQNGEWDAFLSKWQ